jgi:hypothetical protein
MTRPFHVEHQKGPSSVGPTWSAPRSPRPGQRPAPVVSSRERDAVQDGRRHSGPALGLTLAIRSGSET